MRKVDVVKISNRYRDRYGKCKGGMTDGLWVHYDLYDVLLVVGMVWVRKILYLC